nr:ABC transporter permease subunit [uncultured Lichenicoccus sp.]
MQLRRPLAAGPLITWAVGASWAVIVLTPLLTGVGLSVLRHRGFRIVWSLTTRNYVDLLETGRIGVILHTAAMAALVSLTCLVCGFPLAVWLAKRAPGWAAQLVWMCLTLPFFLDPSARTLVLRLVLGTNGLVNGALLATHVVVVPQRWFLFDDLAIWLGLVGPYFPNMVWPIALSLMLIDDGLIDASHDLGAGQWETLRLVLLPLAAPGLLGGLVMTFIPALGDSVVPDLLGGGRHEYLADSIFSLSTAMNYAGASAMATIVFTLLGLSCLPVMLLRRRVVLRQAGA